MSYIPSQAMPHAYVHDDETDQTARKDRSGSGPSAGLLLGGAIAGYLLYRLFR